MSNHNDGNALVVEVLKRGIWCAEERIDRAQREIWRLKLQLAQLGVELPLAESATPPPPTAPADSANQVPTPIRMPLDDLRTTLGRCAECGHTQEAHTYRAAPKCSLCGCQGYVAGGQA